MSGRLGRPDTPADEQLASLLREPNPSSFVVLAGAGSGKTTSLVKALSRVEANHGRTLTSRNQRVACITYTEVAAAEIKDDVGENPLFHVSTIHSFFWTLIEPFQRDIGVWVASRLDRKIVDARERHNKPGTRAKTRTELSDRIEQYEKYRPLLKKVKRFTYHVAGNYGKGIVGHDDVLKMVPDLIGAKPLFAKLAARQFPFIFVDECQDTAPQIVEALKTLSSVGEKTLCLGFFGDPMQRIFVTGAGDIGAGENWVQIEKPENFRCSNSVLEVINHIRRPVDGLVQKSGLDPQTRPVGSVNVFILPADDLRSEQLERVRRWLARQYENSSWLIDDDSNATKVLVIAHRMAATRLGFGNLYSTFHSGPSKTLKAEFDDDRAWPILPFLNEIFPLIDAKEARDNSIIGRLRALSPVLGASNLQGKDMSLVLATINESLEDLSRIVKEGGPGSVAKCLLIAHKAGLLELDSRWREFLEADGDASGTSLSENVVSVLEAFMAGDLHEVVAYRRYIERNSLFSTQHGVKGSEFRNVLVVLDDEEGKHSLYSYDKLFGARELSATDVSNREQGKEDVLDRTRRLLYVCCSRATDSLAIVWFVPEPDVASKAFSKAHLPGAEVPIMIADLNTEEPAKTSISVAPLSFPEEPGDTLF